MSFVDQEMESFMLNRKTVTTLALASAVTLPVAAL